jgi:hypothetical protein
LGGAEAPRSDRGSPHHVAQVGRSLGGSMGRVLLGRSRSSALRSWFATSRRTSGAQFRGIYGPIVVRHPGTCSLSQLPAYSLPLRQRISSHPVGPEAAARLPCTNAPLQLRYLCRCGIITPIPDTTHQNAYAHLLPHAASYPLPCQSPLPSEP